MQANNNYTFEVAVTMAGTAGFVTTASATVRVKSRPDSAHIVGGDRYISQAQPIRFQVTHQSPPQKSILNATRSPTPGHTIFLELLCFFSCPPVWEMLVMSQGKGIVQTDLVNRISSFSLRLLSFSSSVASYKEDELSPCRRAGLSPGTPPTDPLQLLHSPYFCGL